jgi:cytochrome c nitrite reductase small subunit
VTGAERLLIVVAAAVGLAVGVGAYTFVYAKGAAYLTNDPAACANCHIMSEHYAAWQKSSHHAVAACNDCHTPHDPVAKYVVKARNGFWHSFYFTTGRFPDPLRITPANHEVTEGACRVCHAPIVSAIDAGATGDGRAVGAAMGERAEHEDESISCVRCHRHVGHLVR